MIDFAHMCRCQTYLVTVAGVTVSGLAGNDALRKFSCHRVSDRKIDVASSGHAHCLIDICTTRKRVTDSTAKTCCCAAERFYFSRVVMCLVLELEKPFFSGHLPIVIDYVHIHIYTACIVLLTDLHVVEKTL